MFTGKKRRFVEEYLIDLNATQAAVRAGYSEKTAFQQGYRLLKDVDVAAAIAKAQQERSRRTEITQDAVLQELARLGFANMMDYMRVGPDGDFYCDFSEITRDLAAAISEVTVEDFKDGRGEDARDVRRVKFKLYDKRAALVDIGKHLGMFSDKVEVTGKGGTPLFGAISKLTDDELGVFAAVLEKLSAGEVAGGDTEGAEQTRH